MSKKENENMEPPQSGNTTQTKKPTPLPEAEISEVLGLVELVNASGGREDIYKLAAELQIEFGETLAAIRSAELLGLVHTPGGDVEVQPLGIQVARSKINKKKEIICEQVEKLSIFKKITEFLNEKEDKEATKSEVLEKLAELIPNEDAEDSFTHVVGWGRYAELFGYNDDTQSFYLDEEEAI